MSPHRQDRRIRMCCITKPPKSESKDAIGRSGHMINRMCFSYAALIRKKLCSWCDESEATSMH